MNIIKLNNVNKSYAIDKNIKTQVLRGVNIELNSGEMVAILGESGSGKSTLMNLIGGLDQSYEGEIIVEGKNLKDLSESEIDAYRKDKIGFIFQSFNLIPHLTIIENVTIAMTISNVSQKERNKRAIEILSEVGLKSQMNKKPNQLSGGQKQRVAIARALVNDPDIILADEPTGALDSKTSEQVLEIISNIAKKGKLVIMVTHSKRVADKCNRVVTVSDGVILSDTLNHPTSFTQTDDNKPITKSKHNLTLIDSIKLSLQNMKQKLARNTLVALGSSIGIISIILMLGMSTGVKSYINNLMNSNINPLFIEASKAKEETSTQTNTPQPPFSLGGNKELTTEELDELESIKDVDKIELGYTQMVFGSTVKLDNEEYQLSQIGPMSSAIIDDSFKAGKGPGSGEVVISNTLADLITDKYDTLVGKELELQLVENGNIIKGKVKISGVCESASPMGFLLFNFDDIKNIYKDNNLDLGANVANITMKNQESIQPTKDLLTEMGYNMSMPDQMINMFDEMLDVMTIILIVISSISLVVSAIMILVISYISVVERTSEIGVLKAIGARRKDIKRIFTTESLVLGVFTGLSGVAISILISYVGNSISKDFMNVEMIIIRPYDLLVGLIVAVSVSVVSGVLPAAKAAKLDPIESLRHE